MLSHKVDVAVVGAGPAGAATALAVKRLDASARVAVVERSGHSAYPAGETLLPAARRLLAELGVWDRFPACGACEAYGMRASWGSAVTREHAFIFSPFGRGWHVDRRRFDAWLAGEAERAGADVYRHARVLATERRDGVWTLSVLEECGVEREIRARVLVDATGRHSRVARACGARHVSLDWLVGVGVRLRVEPGLADTYTEVEACRDGWWYSAMLPDGDLLAIFMTDADDLRRTPWRDVDAWRALADGAPRTAARIAAGAAAGEPTVYAASSQRLDTSAGDGWLAVGDAAGTVDPLSSQGVMRALRSGIIGARAIYQDACGDRRAFAAHHARHAREYDAYLRTRHAYYALEQRWPDSPFWRRRHTPVTTEGAAHAVRMENQHHEESSEGQAGDLHVRGDAERADRGPGLLEQPGQRGALARTRE